MQQSRRFSAFCALALFWLAGAAHAAPDPVVGMPSGQRLAANCASCHGTDGVAQGNALPSLAGQSKDELIAKMKAYKAGTRPATIMHQLAKGYTDEQIERIAAYLAAQGK